MSIHSCHGLIIRSTPSPTPSFSAPGCTIQYRTDGRYSTNRLRSASKMMCSAPPTAPGPSNGRSRSAATLLRAPSAPTRYFERIA